MLGPLDALNLAPAPVLLIDQTLAQHDWVVRERSAVALDRMRRSGSTILLASHEEDLLRLLADEIWWLRDGYLAARGDPDEILTAYRQHIAARVRAWGDGRSAPLSPRMRRGDGRAEVAGVETIGESGQPTIVWRSGELAVVKATVRFRDAVADPVVGMMIRSRSGLNVYGTNRVRARRARPSRSASGSAANYALATIR
jgi:lipopolysaccharide transport system ATP-binding protein